MPITVSGQFPGQRLPTHKNEFYNYLTGVWRDGLPMTYGGTGYYSGTTLTNFPFTGHPTDSDDWSELSANNPVGNRVSVSSYKSASLLPGAVNEVICSFTVSKAVGPTAQLEELKAFRAWQNAVLFGYHWLDSALNEMCYPMVKAFGPIRESQFSIFPNPASTQTTLQSSGANFREVQLFDVMGKQMYAQRFTSAQPTIQLETGHLPRGIYYLYGLLENGERVTGKLVLVE